MTMIMNLILVLGSFTYLLCVMRDKWIKTFGKGE